MQAKELNSLLLEKFPELKKKFDDETSWQDGIETGSFIVFEDVFMPFLEANIELNKSKEQSDIKKSQNSYGNNA